jgi:hypothetical protein
MAPLAHDPVFVLVLRAACSSVATLAAGGTVVLLAVYSLAIAANLARGRRTLDCGCGIGGTKQPISEWLLVRNAFLAAAALFASRPVTVRPLVWVDALTVAGGLAVASATWMAAHGLAAASARVPRLAPAERAS